MEDGVYLYPNDLLLGRASRRIPSGPFVAMASQHKRHKFVQSTFWKKWTKDYFHTLLVRQKWHACNRNIHVGDIVLIQDSNQIRGNWKLGRVLTADPSLKFKV